MVFNMPDEQTDTTWLNFPTHNGYWFVSHPDVHDGAPHHLYVEIYDKGAGTKALIYAPSDNGPIRYTIFERTNELWKFHVAVTPNKPTR